MRTLQAFTLIELIVVIAIIAMLAAFIFPVFAQAKSAVQTMGVGRAGKQLHTATILYQADSDDTFPIAMYADGPVIQAWFGRQTSTYEYDNSKGTISPYIKGSLGKDPALNAELWFGDKLGIGYNWGVIGSDMHETGNYSTFPNCSGAANSSNLESTSSTVLFATSAYYNAPWLPDGNGKKHMFNFFDPPEFWNGVPNVDFRHQGTSTFNEEDQSLKTTGNAVFIFADGHTRNLPQSKTKSEWFWRQPLSQQ